MTGKRITRNRPHHGFNEALPIGDYDAKLRRDAATDGSLKLAVAIVSLIERTAQRLQIPEAWQHRPIDFTAAYLGIEVAAPAKGHRNVD